MAVVYKLWSMRHSKQHARANSPRFYASNAHRVFKPQELKADAMLKHISIFRWKLYEIYAIHDYFIAQ